MSNRTKAYLSLFTTSVIWGIAGPVIKHTLNSILPFTFLFWRFLVCSIILIIPFIIYIKKHPLKLADLPLLVFLSLMATTINLGLIFLGFQKTSALDGTLINAVTPIFIAILGIIFLKEKVEFFEKIGLTFVLIGSLVTVIQPLFEKTAFPLTHIFGNTLIFIAGIQWAFFVLFFKEQIKKFPPFLITSISSFVALISFFPLAFYEQFTQISYQYDLNLILNRLFQLPQGTSMFGILYMGLLSYIVAYFLYEYALTLIEISESVPFAYLQPLFAAPFAVLWLGEKITLPFFLGACIITFGIIIGEYKKTS